MTEVSIPPEQLGSFTPGKTVPTDNFISKPVPETISEAMDAAPLGFMYDLVYAALGRRLKSALSKDSKLAKLMEGTFINVAVNFRALNPDFGNTRQQPPPPTATPKSAVWGPNKDERLPHTAALPITQGPSVAMPGSDYTTSVLIAKLFHDLRAHIPLVLFNVSSKVINPTALGGGGANKRFFDSDGNVVTQYVYSSKLTVEVIAITYDDTSTGNLLTCIEACFGTFRDAIDNGAYVQGKSWNMVLPIRYSVSGITDTEAPWSSGDSKDGKIYTATVTLEDILFECVAHATQPLDMRIASLPSDATTVIRLPSESAAGTDPISLRLNAGPTRLVVGPLPLNSAVLLDNPGKRVADLIQPMSSSSGLFEILPRRVGECEIKVVRTSSPVSLDVPTAGGIDHVEIIARRRVSVTI
jgi:hypothetical protein